MYYIIFIEGSKMNYTKDILGPLVKESTSISEVLRKLGKKPYGSQHSYLSKVIKKLQIDTSHFRLKNWRKGKKFGFSYPIEDYLYNKRFITSNNLKKRLIKDGLKEKRCENCSITHWNNVELSLELHHKDENHKNNNIENLSILCPNCHDIEHKKKILENRDKKKDDGRGHAKLYLRKQIRPSYEILLSEIEESSFLAVGRKYGVSDNTIRKWIKTYEKYGK